MLSAHKAFDSFPYFSNLFPNYFNSSLASNIFDDFCNYHLESCYLKKKTIQSNCTSDFRWHGGLWRRLADVQNPGKNVRRRDQKRRLQVECTRNWKSNGQTSFCRRSGCLRLARSPVGSKSRCPGGFKEEFQMGRRWHKWVHLGLVSQIYGFLSGTSAILSLVAPFYWFTLLIEFNEIL